MNINRANGFIKLHYKIQDSDIWFDNNALIAFIKMIGFAHYEDGFTSIRFNGKQRHLKRGEFSATVSELSELIGIPVGTLRDVIKRLEDSGRIERESSNRNTIFRICNFSKYQDAPANKPANSPAINPANSPASPTEGKKNIKKLKNIHTKKCSEEEALRILNEVTRRSFRTFPDTKLTRETLSSFTPTEIRTALSKMIHHEWHKSKVDTLSSDYMLRSTTIDKFLSANDTAKKFEKKYGLPQTRVSSEKLQMSRKQLAAHEYSTEGV